jgi:hypothetical protein
MQFFWNRCNGLWKPRPSDLLGWYDASDPLTITSSGSAVSQWNDKSGKGQHLTQGTGAAQPKTGTRTLNGLNVLDCDGGDSMTRSGFPVPASGNLSLFMVAVIDVVDNGLDAVYSMDAANDFQFDALANTTWNGRILPTGIGSQVSLTGGPFAGPSIYNANFYFTEAAAYNAFIDGTQRAVNTAYTAKLSASQILFAFRNRGNSNSPDGCMAEFILVERQCQCYRQKIEGYLAWKWGLVANLPEGHPYKLRPPRGN